ncbi:energy-coupling factor transporter transmembrane protein EcfT [Vitiosangium sp. GDMCC 1.1324]|uniref:energy-coupling factor transporter transmembrane component T family protein n=1 Tax=Vitiosangium sp. (strain GDMCC 1.1324) TaxID=2138576 RepID=UPI000D373057|nr:CbiQ family ECF transporter T component [Vitiosangium sp. GDMCC 1.1324]PTL76661.1 energy-coupling factor transporter transmembrane protein EcfT [Vitiosangium sp. GDMCC 1.1324]
MSLGLYLHRDSLVHAVPAGAKMLGLLAAGTGLLLFPSLPVVSAALGGTLGLYVLARLRPREVAPVLRFSAFVLVPLFAVHVLLSGWVPALEAVLRLVVLLLLATLVSLTTRASDMLDTLERVLRPLARFGLNPTRLGLLLSLTLRFIPLLATWVREIQEAQRVRGLDRNPFAVLVPLLVKTLRTADTLADAIDARCFDSEEPS